MPISQFYRVFKIKTDLAMHDPDMPSPRYHTAIFVETKVPGRGCGTKHHVTGDIVQGMHYESKPYDISAEVESLHSTEFIGYTIAATHPSTWDNVLAGVPAPQRQKAFNVKTMKTEPVKSWDPLTFYDPGEPRRPLIKCTEWIEQLAIPALLSQGLIESGASTLRSD
jgi:hypothetical protein